MTSEQQTGPGPRGGLDTMPAEPPSGSGHGDGFGAVAAESESGSGLRDGLRTGDDIALPSELAAALAAHPDLDGTVVRWFPELASTNDTAAALAAAGAPDGSVVLADRQTAGRGRYGRVWDSPAAAGLYLSVVLRGPQPPVITLLAGVAVAEAVRAATGVAAELKWPNDVVACAARNDVSEPARRKIAGILTEGLSDAGAPVAGAVVGIGINVSARAFPPELVARAAALDTLAGRPVDRAAVCAEVLARLRRWRLRLAVEGAGPVVARWRALAPGCPGRPVSWEVDGARRRGVTAGVDEDGALLVARGGGTERVVGGEVVWEG